MEYKRAGIPELAAKDKDWNTRLECFQVHGYPESAIHDSSWVIRVYAHVEHNYRKLSKSTSEAYAIGQTHFNRLSTIRRICSLMAVEDAPKYLEHKEAVVRLKANKLLEGL